ncbi:M56 family metallopeptidase [Chitinophaga nivalis]|uniref:M56 family metallopeptidase n=1 Tax=Chitinophaga nivalis TaxID=2991709 RepID=A0ABT3IFZ6_9BACT|nr:M56 family metallopeptidase [Chitinophaga nivalis]MCW3467424.1 M56 family metallopeptidase [Chitinophaga nivalis]MCW3482884.1 M56 family metallopeptidase [Chitinophaga nivalis]
MFLLIYLAKVILCSAVLYGYYYIALRNNRFHQWNRYYLILITLVSLVIPLLRIPLPFQQQAPATVLTYTNRIITLRENAIPVAAPVINFRVVLTVIYAGILLLLLLRLVIGYFKIRQLIRTSAVQDIPPFRFIEHPAVTAPFSFFRYIFWDHQTQLNSPEGQQILRHELVHLREKHSADKILMEIITAVYWINPFFHLLKRELSLVHEFLADKKAAGEEVAGYAQTILQMAFHSKQFRLTNDFFHPPIKRRILMLTQFRTPRFSYLRRIMVLPLAAFIFCALAFVADKHPAAIRMLPATGTPTPTTPIIATPGVTAPAMAQANMLPVQNSTDTPRTFVDQPPAYVGGETALATYLSRNITYPKAAHEKGTTGTIFVQFVVTQNGAVQAVKAVGKNPGDGLQEEAVRVIEAMPRWIPGRDKGKKVSVLFNLPIRFTLEEDSVKQEKATPPPAQEQLYTFVDQPPVFPGQEEQLVQYLRKSIRMPAAAVAAKVNVTVFVQFTVHSDGSVGDTHTVGALKGYGLEEEAIRVVKEMPKWKPGVHNGRPVSVQYNLPISFRTKA